MEQPEFFEAFVPHRAFTNRLGVFRCETRQVAELSLPSGRIVVSDPLVDLITTPLSQRVPPGRYPVILAIAHLDTARGVEERIACAMLRISEQRPVRWAVAVNEQQDARASMEGEFLGYDVDSGMGCFASVESAEALAARSAADEDYDDSVIDAAEQVYAPSRQWADVLPDPRTDENVVIFSSGLGDGDYQSYWGYDEHDEPVCLITDFGIVSAGEEPPPFEKRPWWKLW